VHAGGRLLLRPLVCAAASQPAQPAASLQPRLRLQLARVAAATVLLLLRRLRCAAQFVCHTACSLLFASMLLAARGSAPGQR
jgi:hypothetical protein